MFTVIYNCYAVNPDGSKGDLVKRITGPNAEVIMERFVEWSVGPLYVEEDVGLKDEE